MRPARDYSPLSRLRPPAGATPDATMRLAVDALWNTLSSRSISWIGFYIPSPAGDSLILGHCRDKPACSPIGLHGVCGRAFRERRTVIVRDVASLGENYVACDPRDRSELVIPLLASSSQGVSCLGVLDADSHDTDAFSPDDAAALTQVLVRIGLTLPVTSDPILL